MIASLRRCSVMALPIAIILLQGCSVISPEPAWKAAVAGDGPGQVQKVSSAPLQVSNLPKSRRGNAPVYHVFKQAYRVMDTAKGFQESGVASWYGKKFHGRETSSGEVYDMYQLTAAHKHLPLPTFVRVTRMDTGQSVIVKVNDRGPFVDNRVIDLSFAAAAKLDMLGKGKADVYLEALSTHEVELQVSHSDAGPASSVVKAPASSNGQIKPEKTMTVTIVAAVPDAASASASAPLAARENSVYLQVGAYSEVPNAQRMLNSVQAYTDAPTIIDHDLAHNLYRVRVGPLSNRQVLRQTRESLSLAGISSYTLVATSP